MALAIVLPNLIWQANHGFISIDFLRSIHARDVRIGRTDGFLWRQFLVPASLFTVPLWIAGLFSISESPRAKRYRALGWTFVAALALFAVAHARDYYTAPLYPMLLAAGAVYVGTLAALGQRAELGRTRGGVRRRSIAFLLPIAPINSRWFQTEIRGNGDLREEIGWPELVDRIATDPRLTAARRARRPLASSPATTGKRERSIFMGPRMACRRH